MDLRKSLNIFQWNARGILNKLQYITEELQKFDIVIINETWLDTEKSLYK